MGLSAFKKAAKKTTKKKSDDKPQFKVSGVAATAHQRFLEGKAKKKDGEATIKRSEGVLLPVVKDEHLKTCLKQNKYYSSIKAVREDENGDEHSLTVSFSNRYSNIPVEEEDSLREIYKDSYDDYFKEITEVSLSSEALQDDSFTEKLVEIVGEENFARYFDVKNYIKPTPEYHEARFKNENLSKMHQKAEDEGLIKPTKPSIKQ